jgi:hypothetical protein
MVGSVLAASSTSLAMALGCCISRGLPFSETPAGLDVVWEHQRKLVNNPVNPGSGFGCPNAWSIVEW